jgi:hypothetical protein
VLFAVLGAASIATAQPLGPLGGSRREVTVISVSGQSVFIDAGRDAGIQPGSTLIFLTPSGQRIEATIQDVSATNARAELRPGDIAPPINASATVISSPVPPSSTASPMAVPEHPPWMRREDPRTADTPLLAPAFATPPSERPTTLTGRLYTNGSYSHDNIGQSNYAFMRSGAWLELTNPFKDGGRILIAGDGDYRGSDIWSGERRDDVNGRLDRLSYAWGLDQHAPLSFEIGRFYSASLPEVGLFDGAEAKIHFQNGWSLGAGVGLYPAPFPDQNLGEDYGFHVFADYQADQLGSLATTIGYQQTWHQGKPDRNVLIGRINTRPIDQLWLYASAMVDIYGSEDNRKDQALDLTQLLTQATWTPDQLTGINATFVHTGWPDLLREEFVNLPDRLVRSGRVDRISTSVWRKVSEKFRLTGRGSYWIDQDRDGWGAELGGDWYDLWHESSSLSATVYMENASSDSSIGGRLQLTQNLGAVRIFLGYEVLAYSVDRVVVGREDFLRHTIRGDVGWSSGRWYFDVDSSYSFGDNEESITIGFYAEYRF